MPGPAAIAHRSWKVTDGTVAMCQAACANLQTMEETTGTMGKTVSCSVPLAKGSSEALLRKMENVIYQKLGLWLVN